MATPRLSRLFSVLLLASASQLPAQAEENQPASTAESVQTVPETGAGVRPVEQADPVTPKERPRLKDNEVVSLKRRLEVHGGMSFTYGWASGGRDFREAGAWVSYFDPQSGLGMAFGFSRFSGDVPYDYGYYPGGYGHYGYYDGRAGGFYGGPGSTYDVDLFLVRPNFSLSLGFSQTEYSGRPVFDGSGYGLRRHY